MADDDSLALTNRGHLDSEEKHGGALAGLKQAGRVAAFWRRAGGVYLGYKGAQVRAAFLRRVCKWDADRLRDDFWAHHHAWAGDQFYSMAVDLRGFYLKIGQFFAARAEFVPEPICRRLSRLHDQVPPMPPAKARAVLEGELGGVPVEDVFEWIDLENVLGSASIAQVHKGKLRGRSSKAPGSRRARLLRALTDAEPPSEEEGPIHDLRWVFHPGGRERDAVEAVRAIPSTPGEAARAAVGSADGPKDGIVAVKLQYPGAQDVMGDDLVQIRRFSGFIQKHEIKFDLLSAVDELAAQVRLEFDFQREATIMDTIADNLKDMRNEVEIPHSVPGLVTRRLLVMNFLEGEQITRLKERVKGMSQAMRKRASRRILHRIADAYGRMILTHGLFQADPHPGNIMVMRGGRVGLIDYGQSKSLSPETRLAFAQLVVEMAKGRDKAQPELVAARLHDMGLKFENNDNLRIQSMMAFGMFDTQLSHKVDPFSADSPLKALRIKHFPPEVFFVLRTVQMLRGLAGGMKFDEFSIAQHWQHYASDAVKRG